MEHFSTRGLTRLLSYPFRKPGWEKKIIILAAFFIGGTVIPIIPWFFAYGYIAELIRRAAREDDPDLPEWENWNELLMDGLRLTAISLVYMVPVILIFGAGFISYMGSMLAMPVLAEGRRGTAMLFPFLFISSFGFFMCSLICGTLFSLVAGLFVPVATTHAVVKRSLGAFFHISAWARLLRANLGGYFVFFVILFGLVFVLQIFYSVFAWTLILLPLAFFIPLLLAPYLTLVSALMWGRIYREAQETLALVEARDPSAPAR